MKSLSKKMTRRLEKTASLADPIGGGIGGAMKRQAALISILVMLWVIGLKVSGGGTVVVAQESTQIESGTTNWTPVDLEEEEEEEPTFA
jgi:hypothetical protein